MTRTPSLVFRLWEDQSGFVLTAELVLISTFLVLGLIVGLTSVQSAVVGELEDVGTAIGSLNQTYQYQGMISHKTLHRPLHGPRGGTAADCGIKAYTAGSAFYDLRDECDAGPAGHEMNCACSSFSGIIGTAPVPEADVTFKKRDKTPSKEKTKPRKSRKGKKNSDGSA